MNQITNIDDSSKTPTNEEKSKTSFLPSNYYYEKDLYANNSNLMSSMLSQYYNFEQTKENSNENKESNQKAFVKPGAMSNASNSQQNPFNITNNISISNYSFTENQKKEVNFEPQYNLEDQNSLKIDEKKKKKLKKKKIQNYGQQQQNSFQNLDFDTQSNPFYSSNKFF